MGQSELADMDRRRAGGDLTPVDAARLLDEVRRLRRWLAYAAENISYEYPQMQAYVALSDTAPHAPVA
jgi:hypothetical protein